MNTLIFDSCHDRRSPTFEHGFVTAAALATRLGDPNLAAKMLGHAGFQALDYSELNAADKQQLQLVNQQPGMKLTGLGTTESTGTCQ
ncbi:hypothetical protein [Pseudomonas fluorescens]|uniref:hypothetical protein n=1 Tax=Pseudomonas fluorescens TaxID=294 RepID=UPI00209E6EAE